MRFDWPFLTMVVQKAPRPIAYFSSGAMTWSNLVSYEIRSLGEKNFNFLTQP